MSLEKYEAMVDAGILTKRDKVHLINGVLVAKMNQTDVVATFAEQALQIKLYIALTADVPAQVEQVKVRHILVDSADKANALLAKLKAGTNFADLAKSDSQDTLSAAQGGDLGWSPKGIYTAEFESAVWSAKPSIPSAAMNTGSAIGSDFWSSSSAFFALFSPRRSRLAMSSIFNL